MPNKETTKSEVPVTLVWQNARMVRSHSIQACVREIVGQNAFNDVVKVNIVGNPGTGKTTLANTLAHLIHKLAKIPYTVKVLGREELINIEETLKNLTPTNHVIIFDDISFLASSTSGKKIQKIQQLFTEIRHLPGKQDIKVITIFNFHYTMAISKYLRQSNFHFYTTIGTSDHDNVLKLIGSRYANKLKFFNSITHQANTPPNVFKIGLGGKGKSFSYTNREPFAPALFYNDDKARYIVFPKREWIDTVCMTCTAGIDDDEIASGNIEDFDKAIQTKFTKQTIMAAIRLKMYISGYDTYSKKTQQARRFIDKWEEKNPITLDQLAKFYGLSQTKTKLKIDPSIFEPNKDDKE